MFILDGFGIERDMGIGLSMDLEGLEALDSDGGRFLRKSGGAKDFFDAKNTDGDITGLREDMDVPFFFRNNIDDGIGALDDVITSIMREDTGDKGRRESEEIGKEGE
jgi:hypothetical protein